MDEIITTHLNESYDNESIGKESLHDESFDNESLGSNRINLLEDNKEEQLILPPVGKQKGKKIREYERPYPIAFDAARFVLRDNRTIDQLLQARNKAQYELDQGHALAGKDAQKKALKQNKIALKGKELTYQERVKRKADVFDAEAAILYKNKRFMRTDKKPMQRVKKCMAALRNFLQEDNMSDLRNEDGSLNPNMFWNKVNLAYQTTIDACTDYLEHRNPSRWFGKGMERYRMVDRLRKRCQQELGDYQDAKEAIVQHAIIGASKNLKNPREVLENISFSEVIGEPVWMNHGNSTDVYRVVIKMADSGEEKTFYMKENLQLLSVNLPAFVNRRLNQLTASKENKGDVKMEEARMRENHADLKDYDNGIQLFKAMKKALDGVEGPDRLAMEERYKVFFGQDFDEMFREFHTYNDAIKGKINVNVETLLAQWKAKLKADSKNELAKKVVKNLERAIGKGGKKAAKVMTAKEWIKARIESGKMGLDKSLDSGVLKVLYGMQEKKDEPLKENNAGRIQTFFQVTCGKEVELYGQMKARSDNTDDDIAAANNTATARLAAETGFKDLICTSFSSMVDIKRRDGTTGPGFFTIIEGAEGEELVTLQHRAIDEKKKLVLSSKAVMQLQELYSFDLACLQVDRHGRNFRCKFEETDNEIIIKTVKAYDNDMSFTEETLDTAFLTEDKKGTKKAGFLPPLFKTVKKDSLEYTHIARNYFGGEVTRGLKASEKAVFRATREGKQDLELTDLESDKFLSLPLAWKLDIEAPGALKIRGTDKVEEEGEMRHVKYDLQRLYDTVNEIIYNPQGDEVLDRGFDADEYIMNKLLKKDSELTEEELTKLGALTYEIQKIHENYDFTDVHLTGAIKTIFERWGYLDRVMPVTDDEHRGVVEAWLDSLLYYLTNAYGHDKAFIRGYDSKKIKSLGAVRELEIKKGENKPGEEGDLYVPTMLHFSYKAYRNLQRMQKKLKEGENNSLLKDLADSNITDQQSGNQKRSKLTALRMRVDQQLKQLKEAEKAAKIFYKAKGYTGVHAKFFLTDEEAEQIKDLREFTWNAGETYLAIDNDEYLAGQEEFYKMMTEGEKMQWLNATNNRYTDQKRHKFHKVNTIKDNPLSNTIYRGH